MALCSTVHLPWSVLDLGTVKRPLVACLVGYVWVSELCASSSNRHLGAFNMSITLTNTSSDEVNLLPFNPGEIDMHIINVSSLCTSKGQPCCPVLSQLQFSRVPFCGTCPHSGPGMTKPGPVGLALLIDILLPILATVESKCFDS
jgi:hypothetical protein